MVSLEIRRTTLSSPTPVLEIASPRPFGEPVANPARAEVIALPRNSSALVGSRAFLVRVPPVATENKPSHQVGSDANLVPLWTAIKCPFRSLEQTLVGRTITAFPVDIRWGLGAAASHAARYRVGVQMTKRVYPNVIVVRHSNSARHARDQ